MAVNLSAIAFYSLATVSHFRRFWHKSFTKTCASSPNRTATAGVDPNTASLPHGKLYELGIVGTLKVNLGRFFNKHHAQLIHNIRWPAAALIGASHTTLGHIGPRTRTAAHKTRITARTITHTSNSLCDVANSMHTPRHLLTATTLTVRSRPMVAVAALAR